MTRISKIWNLLWNREKSTKWKVPYKSMYSSNWQFENSLSLLTFTQSLEDGIITNIDNIKKNKPWKIEKKPIEVWEELSNNDKAVVDCSNLDEKIAVVEDRIKVLSEYTWGKDLDHEYVCLQYLNNRKKHEEVKDLFSYPTTTFAMMNDICNIYTLKIARINQYSWTMPQEAIDELKTYTKSFWLLTWWAKPEIRLIVPEKDFKTEEKKRDPILLAESPFWSRWYILWAWDKEVAIVDELIYDWK